MDNNRSTYVSHLSPKQHATVVRLVGDKCINHCFLGGVPTEALWDIGAQVSLVSREWMTRNLPGTETRQIDELLAG